MGRLLPSSPLFLFFLPLLFPPASLATDHIVGANHGWQVPADAGAAVNLNYSVWSAAQHFYLEDEVSFHYQSGLHSVFQVNYSVFVNCSFSMYYGDDWIYNWTSKNGRTVIPLNRTQVYYFACGIGNHCQQGMKVAVNVTKNATALAPSKAKSSTSKNSASSLRPGLLSRLVLAQALLHLSVSVLCCAI